jgi:hypothetical protein
MHDLRTVHSLGILGARMGRRSGKEREGGKRKE